MNKDIIRQIVHVLVFAATLAFNILSQALRLNGTTNGEIANEFAIFFFPANYVFGTVWSFLYLAQLGFVIYQALPSQRENPLLRRMGWWYVLGSAANCAWIASFHYRLFWLSLLLMLVLLVSLCVIYLRIGVGTTAFSRAETLFVQIPFSAYLGWITVATVANVTQVLAAYGWDGWGISPEAWGAVVMVVSALITGRIALKYADAAYVAVVVWALIGIIVRYPNLPLIAGTAGVMALTIVVVLVGGWLWNRQSSSPVRSKTA